LRSPKLPPWLSKQLRQNLFKRRKIDPISNLPDNRRTTFAAQDGFNRAFLGD
jgi:hypothetical protein